MLKRVKSTILSDVRVGRIDVRTLGCACADNAFIVNVLKRLKLFYVAGMHARSETEWTPKDWYLHCKQEDEHLFPMLIQIAKEDKYLDNGESDYILKEVHDLYDDHIKYVYPVVAKNQLPDEGLMKVHADRENKLIKKYYRQLLHLPITTLRNNSIKVGGGFDLIPNNESSFEISPAAKIALGITVGGLALSFGAPIAFAVIPLFVAGTSVVMNLNKEPEFTDSVSEIELAIWESNTNIPSDKLNNHGQKFIDPYALDGACWPGVDQSGITGLMSLPKDGKIRIEYMHKNALATKPTIMPAADIMISAADSFGAQAITTTENNLKDRQNWWADKISQYARSTKNGWVIAFAELYAAFLRWMPANWNKEYDRAVSIANDTADELKITLLTTVGFSIPYPMHSLDYGISDLDDLKHRTSLFNSNLKKTLVLPNKAKSILRTFFALLASYAATDSDVQTAINYVDNSDWGRRNLASDEQVYLVGVVFAKASNQDIVNFSSELWDRCRGWNRFKGLATNNHILYLNTANGSKSSIGSSIGSSSNGGFTYDQEKTVYSVGWNKNIGPDDETGYEFAAECITNARQLNYLDIVLTALEMVSEKTGSSNPVNKKKFKINLVESNIPDSLPPAVAK